MVVVLPVGIVAVLADELAVVAGAESLLLLLPRREQVETVGLRSVRARNAAGLPAGIKSWILGDVTPPVIIENQLKLDIQITT